MCAAVAASGMYCRLYACSCADAQVSLAGTATLIVTGWHYCNPMCAEETACWHVPIHTWHNGMSGQYVALALLCASALLHVVGLVFGPCCYTNPRDAVKPVGDCSVHVHDADVRYGVGVCAMLDCCRFLAIILCNVSVGRVMEKCHDQEEICGRGGI
jgi:hypothetical protein